MKLRLSHRWQKRVLRAAVPRLPLTLEQWFLYRCAALALNFSVIFGYLEYSVMSWSCRALIMPFVPIVCNASTPKWRIRKNVPQPWRHVSINAFFSPSRARALSMDESYACVTTVYDATMSTVSPQEIAARVGLDAKELEKPLWGRLIPFLRQLCSPMVSSFLRSTRPDRFGRC